MYSTYIRSSRIPLQDVADGRGWTRCGKLASGTKYPARVPELLYIYANIFRIAIIRYIMYRRSFIDAYYTGTSCRHCSVYCLYIMSYAHNLSPSTYSIYVWNGALYIRTPCSVLYTAQSAKPAQKHTLRRRPSLSLKPFTKDVLIWCLKNIIRFSGGFA